MTNLDAQKRSVLLFLTFIGTLIGFFPGAGIAQNYQNQSGQNFVVNSNPTGAVITLEGDYKVSGRTPFTVTFPLAGYYRITAEKLGYQTYSNKVFLTGNSESNLTITLKKLSRLKAGLRSLVVPGWGQFYSDRKFQAFFFATAGVASGAFALYSQIDYKNEIDEFNRLNQRIGVSLVELNRQYDKIEDASSLRKKAFFLLGSVWLYNFIDAILFFPAHHDQLEITSNKKVEISQQLSTDSFMVGVDLKF